MPAGAADDQVVCSSKGCRAAAEHLLVWNNPRLHAPEREKVWSACGDHRDTLGEFLNVRGFLRRIDRLPPRSTDGRNSAGPDNVQPA